MDFRRNHVLKARNIVVFKISFVFIIPFDTYMAITNIKDGKLKRLSGDDFNVMFAIVKEYIGHDCTYVFYATACKNSVGAMLQI